MHRKYSKLMQFFAAFLLLEVAGFAHAIAPITSIYQDPELTSFQQGLTGNPIAATNSSGALIWKENFRPFGERLNNEAAASTNRQWFHRKAADAETGLSYFGARYYDPVIGRFMGVDAVGVQDSNLHSFNRYAYGNGNPYRYIDPDGKSASDIFEGTDYGSGPVAIPNILTPAGEAAVGIAASLIPPVRAAQMVGNALGGNVGVTDVLPIKIPVGKIKEAAKPFSKEKQALVDMAKADKKKGVTAEDMQAYKDLNKQLPDPFPSNKVRGPEVHPNRPHGKEPHGHVGPVDHIPIKKK